VSSGWWLNQNLRGGLEEKEMTDSENTPEKKTEEQNPKLTCARPIP
jgi:hypothetical protein